MFADIKDHWKYLSRRNSALKFLAKYTNTPIMITSDAQYNKDRLALLVREHSKVAVFDYLKLIEDEKCLSVERVNEEFPMVVRYSKNIFS